MRESMAGSSGSERDRFRDWLWLIAAEALALTLAGRLTPGLGAGAWLALALGAAAALRPWRGWRRAPMAAWRRLAWTAGWPLLGWTACGWWLDRYPQFALVCFAAGLALGLVPSQPGHRARQALAVGAVAAAALVGCWVLVRFLTAPVFLAWVPPLGRDLLLGAAFGLFLGLGREALAWAGEPLDPIDQVLETLRPHLDAATLDEAACLVQAYHRARDLLPGLEETHRPPLRRSLRQIGRHALLLLRHRTGLDRDLAALRAEKLEERREELAQKLAAAGDPVVRESYEAALRLLDQQGEVIADLDTTRQRIVAQLAAYRSALSQLYTALVQLRAAGDPEGAGGARSRFPILLDQIRDLCDTGAAAVDLDG